MSMSVLKASLIVIVPIMFMVSSAVILNAQTPATEGTDELCGLNPGLHAAITSTLASHPPTGYEDTETYRSLMYFWGTVIKDAEWCQNGRMVGVDPDLAERTMRWHYGNASEFMRQYTEMVQGTSTPAPAATPSATPVPAAPAASVWTVGDRYTDGITGTISVQIVTIAVSHNVDSLWESPGLLIRCSSTKPYEFSSIGVDSTWPQASRLMVYSTGMFVGMLIPHYRTNGTNLLRMRPLFPETL